MLSNPAKTRLKVLCQKLRGELSQRDFASLYGLSHSTVRKWEAQDIDNLPTEKSLRILARLTSSSVEDVIEYIVSNRDDLAIKAVPEGRRRHEATIDADLLVELLESLPESDRRYVRDKVWGKSLIEVAAA